MKESKNYNILIKHFIIPNAIVNVMYLNSSKYDASSVLTVLFNINIRYLIMHSID